MKIVPLSDCHVKYKDPTEKTSDKAFIIEDSQGNRSKFSAKTAALAQSWVDKIKQVVSQEEDRKQREVICMT